MIETLVCVPVLNLYAQPDMTSEVISQALYGWKIIILEKYQGFQFIQTSDGYRGWIENQAIMPLADYKENLKRIKLLYNATPIYPSCHVKSNPLWILPFEVELVVLAETEEEESRWIQVQLVEGRIGWIQRGHITFNLSPLSRIQMLNLSCQFLGLPYIWGGVSSFGFDCSGFIQMLWRQRGILLPRDARQQYQHAACHAIAWEELEAGDLLFYGSSQANICHVGLYLGNQTLIHASVKPIPILQKSSLDEPSLKQRFAYRAARRLPIKS